jgi:hypothetical protein
MVVLFFIKRKIKYRARLYLHFLKLSHKRVLGVCPLDKNVRNLTSLLLRHQKPQSTLGTLKLALKKAGAEGL